MVAGRLGFAIARHSSVFTGTPPGALPATPPEAFVTTSRGMLGGA